jgi:hypothetical protein
VLYVSDSPGIRPAVSSDMFALRVSRLATATRLCLARVCIDVLSVKFFLRFVLVHAVALCTPLVVAMSHCVSNGFLAAAALALLWRACFQRACAA